MTLISPIILKKYGIPFSRVCITRGGSTSADQLVWEGDLSSFTGEMGEGTGQVWVWQGLHYRLGHTWY